MKNSEIIEVSKAFFRTEKGIEALDAYEEWVAENHEVSAVDERLSKLTSSRNLLKKPAAYIVAVLQGEGIALTPIQIVAKINAQLRTEKKTEMVTIGQVNGWLRLQGIRTEKKPNAPLQKDEAGRISLIGQPHAEEADKSTATSTLTEKRKVTTAGR